MHIVIEITHGIKSVIKVFGDRKSYLFMNINKMLNSYHSMFQYFYFKWRFDFLEVKTLI